MNDHERADDVAWGGNPPELDEELVASLIGKRLLIGLTYVKYSGEFIKQKQLHGIVEKISKEAGIVLRLPEALALGSNRDFAGIGRHASGYPRRCRRRRAYWF
jgi:hypothetical protein